MNFLHSTVHFSILCFELSYAGVLDADRFYHEMLKKSHLLILSLISSEISLSIGWEAVKITILDRSFSKLEYSLESQNFIFGDAFFSLEW